MIDAYVSQIDFITFILGVVGMLTFVLTLKKGAMRYQFAMLAWCVCFYTIVVASASTIISNIFQGLIWFFLPASAVAINDAFAYFCGVFFGKTPLIKLSPKKTWEGFIGGWIFTMIYCIIVGNILQK